MKVSSVSICLFVSILLLSLSRPSPVHAIEGAVGRPLTGLQITPYAGVVPPTPGWIFTVLPIFYDGTVSANVQVPIAGNLVFGVEAVTSFNVLQATYIWNTKPGHWNFASSAGLPLVYTGVNAQVQTGNNLREVHSNLSSQFDSILVPLVASYHLNETNHVSFNMTIYAPTGDYEVGRLANNGMNVWTFTPTIAYTRIFPQSNVEFSAIYNIGFYTKNPDTDYESGALADLEFLTLKHFTNGSALGGVFGWIEQYSDDKGGVAERLDGFKGRSLGVGPIFTYDTKLNEKVNFSFSLRWIYEFEVKNRTKGIPASLQASFVF